MDFFEVLPKLLEQPLLIVLLVFMLTALGVMAWAMRAQSALYSEAPAKLTAAIDQAVKTVVGIYQKMLDESQQQIKDLREEITSLKTLYVAADATSRARISELERKLEDMEKRLTAVTNERDTERVKFAKDREQMEGEINKLRGEVAELKAQLEATGKAALGLPPTLPIAGVEPPKDGKPTETESKAA
jgi:septal ring factor EnvC (AmiA/AmiB activator)